MRPGWSESRRLGRLMLHRGLARDHETRPDHVEAMIRIAALDNLLRRATGETTPTWRDPTNDDQPQTP